MKQPTKGKSANTLAVLRIFLNSKTKTGGFHVELLHDLEPLLIIPDALVIKGRAGTLSNASKSALFSTYIGYLDILVQKINVALKIELTVDPGFSEIAVVNPGQASAAYFPLRPRIDIDKDSNDCPEILWSDGKIDIIPNPTYQQLVRRGQKGRRIIRNHWGKFIVGGQPPNQSIDTRSTRKWCYGIIGASLVNGLFSKMRMCRYEKCKTIFLTPNLHKAFCKPRHQKLCENLYYPSKIRVKKIRKIQDRKKRQDRKRKVLSLIPKLEEMAKKPDESVEDIQYIEKNVGTESYDAARPYLQNGNREKALSILLSQGKSHATHGTITG